MAKPARAECGRCEHLVIAPDPFCGSCGYPSPWATHEERTAWEVAQYRRKSETDPIATPLDRPKPTIVIDKPKTRRLGLFGRKAHAPQLLKSEPKAKAPEPILKAVPAQPEPIVVAPEPIKAAAPKAAAPAKVVAAKPAAPARSLAPAKPAPRVSPRARDKEPAGDAPATVLAMRMLNARVAELDAQVQELQRQIEAMSETPRSGFGR
jgi:hypothetical protein